MTEQARDFIVIETLRAAAKIRREALARGAGILWFRYLVIFHNPAAATPREIARLKAALERLLPQAMEAT